jgi:hypothetical protein
MSAFELRGDGPSANVRREDMEPSPRFIVREVDGWPIRSRAWSHDHSPMLSVSVLDTAYNYAEVARFNEETEKLSAHRSKQARRDALRARGRGLAAILEAEHAA